MIKNAWVYAITSVESHYNCVGFYRSLSKRNISHRYIASKNLVYFNNKFFYHDKEIERPDIIYSVNQFLFRTDVNNTVYRKVNDIIKSGVICSNKFIPTFNATDKWKAFNIMKNNNIRTPDTILIDKDTKYDGSIISRLGSPFVLKLIKGATGNKYTLCYSEEELKLNFNTLNRMYDDITAVLAQQFISSTAGMIVTVGVVKDISYRAVIRIGDPSSNIKFLGDTENNRTQIAYKVDNKLRSVCDAVMNAFDLDCARIDMMVDDGEYYVLEANPPGGMNITDLMHNCLIADDMVERSIQLYG